MCCYYSATAVNNSTANWKELIIFWEALSLFFKVVFFFSLKHRQWRTRETWGLFGGALPVASRFLCDLPFHHSSEQLWSGGDDLPWCWCWLRLSQPAHCSQSNRDISVQWGICEPSHGQAPASQQPLVFPFPPQEQRCHVQIWILAGALKLWRLVFYHQAQHEDTTVAMYRLPGTDCLSWRSSCPCEYLPAAKDRFKFLDAPLSQDWERLSPDFASLKRSATAAETS